MQNASSFNSRGNVTNLSLRANVSERGNPIDIICQLAIRPIREITTHSSNVRNDMSICYPEQAPAENKRVSDIRFMRGVFQGLALLRIVSDAEINSA